MLSFFFFCLFVPSLQNPVSISHSGPIWIQPATFQVVWRHRYLVATMLDRVFLTQKMIADLRPDVACFRALSLGLWPEHSSFSAGQSEPRTPGTLDPRQWTEGSFFMQRCSWEPSVLLLLTLPSSSSLSLCISVGESLIGKSFESCFFSCFDRNKFDFLMHISP